MITNCVDIIGVITQEWDEKGNSVRWIQTRSTPRILAGTRYKFMAPKIKFGYNEFVKAVSDAVEAEEKNGAIVVDRIERQETQSLNIKDLMKEAKELWEQLISKDNNNVNILRRKIELIFGRQMKLSDVVEGQE